MNTYKQLLPRTILAGSFGFAAMLLVSTPSCKAQEVSPDHFTDSGVQDVYDAAPAKTASPAVKQTRFAAAARARQINAPTTVQTAARHNAVLSAKLDTQAVDNKRKSAVSTLPKQ